MRKMCERIVRQPPITVTAASDLHPESARSLFDFHIRILELPCRNQTILLIWNGGKKALEDEIAKALLYCSADELMIVDLKRRMLHLRDEHSNGSVMQQFGIKACTNTYPIATPTGASMRTEETMMAERIRRKTFISLRGIARIADSQS